jgi:hypothetical protein
VKEVLNDPKLLAEGEKSQRYIDYQDPDTTRKKVDAAVSNLTPEQKAQIKQVLSRAK